MNHSQIFVNPFRSKEFEKCVKKESSKDYILKKETFNPNLWFLSKIIIWYQTYGLGISVQDMTELLV
ncbi:hypothetical protein LEP1GSC096_0679 [Leptospira interrogans serovar Hebdomadis str. R499]|uniref:hypothetical protein n=1 Tax=Leptospira interrogans TaxID=173 RepID=UPI00027850A5|nr:hypothetical protein [Leptospira interrogans]EJO78566.1 hypothetical protein LEP1GSC045_3109 [Leptospira interrogans serovar Pomona str. Kennewicki LC82-25]EKN98765.1 hypothetical protein LEP1GSC014_2743 [Leptospira interrogans serovar Pomona str. Pomona]EKR26436.1 hypothetical protein LEP1GSC087_3907 [Leptospira interrogans serovar Bataviae str. L1111]EKR38193.1 hypothetical protein LEP1GSC096_0679 [Leptospira interrogans serovar Hebdomadis str. R499]EMF32500.1 hypothetical protein LEP1GSC